MIKSLYYFGLINYLAKADFHYVEGRFLWISHAFTGAGNLLWLSFEQLMKFLIVQAKIKKETIRDVEILDLFGKKSKVFFDINEKDLSIIRKVLDKLFFIIEPRHRLPNLITTFRTETEIELNNEFHECLQKINEYFKKRYVEADSRGYSINPLFLETIDKLYFFLRGFINPQIPQSLIDEMIFRKRFNIIEPIPYFETVFLNNKSIFPREYPDIFDKISDGRIVAHNGIKQKIFPSGSEMDLMKKGIIIQQRWAYLRIIDFNS